MKITATLLIAATLTISGQRANAAVWGLDLPPPEPGIQYTYRFEGGSLTDVFVAATFWWYWQIPVLGTDPLEYFTESEHAYISVGGPPGTDGVAYTPYVNGYVSYGFHYNQGADEYILRVSSELPSFFHCPLYEDGGFPCGLTWDPTNLMVGGEGTEPPHFTVQESAIPEPAEWALMLVGFGIAGAALRSRRTQLQATCVGAQPRTAD